MDNRQLLEKVKNGELSIDTALEQLSKGYSDIAFAKLDMDRKNRTGFSEVVYCQGKTNEHLLQIFTELYNANGEVLGTRASVEQFEYLRANSKIDNIEYDETSRILKVEKYKPRQGRVAVCCAGTTDIPVAEEAAKTAEFFGCRVDRYYDIGVCGLHRVLDNTEQISKANCVIAVAGMEGALPSVLGGLVSVPIIAVPTSVGYGASFGGITALLSMLNSCANGVSVVNIDNGYGAGYIATQINNLAKGAKNE